MQKLYRLQGVVQHYSWGGSQFIPALINELNAEKKSFAEYWLGAHPKAPAQLINGSESSLYDAIMAAPDAFLGTRVQQAYGTLPYLFKILDVQQMLSIQVHPSMASAKEGYAAENEKGVPLSAPHRNYKDQNHKPELMVALSEFWLLHGFKSAIDIQKVFAVVPEFAFLKPVFEQEGYKGLYQTVMTLPQESVDAVLAPLLKKVLPLYHDGSLPKSDAHFWAARAVQTFCKGPHYDRGIFSIYFFNLLQLHPGEGIFQPGGMPHAYLEGQNVEVMANSDNVLRAGLTDKHVDVAELLKHVVFEPTVPFVLRNQNENEQIYRTPAAEFELTKFTLSEAAFFKAESATLLFVYEGSVLVTVEEKTLPFSRGEAALILANASFEIKPADCTAMVFAVTTPVGKK